MVLFADLTAMGARLALPLAPVPLTLQTAMVLMSGALLGSRDGALGQLVYLGMGLAGLPVFTTGGGAAYLFKPTFGYLLGFIPGAWLTGKLLEWRPAERYRDVFVALAAGLVPVYLVGVSWLVVSLKYVVGSGPPIGQLLKMGLLIPLPGDILKILLVTPLIRTIHLPLHGSPRVGSRDPAWEG
jgi:biotin transport system substrate-specific component